MKIAGSLALLIGLLFGGIAIADIRDDAQHSGERLSDGFAELRAGDQAALDRDSHEAEERKSAENHEWVGCAGFIIAGIALLSAGSKKSGAMASSQASA